jgi:hypothetical protein
VWCVGAPVAGYEDQAAHEAHAERNPMSPADLRRTTRWAGLRPGDAVHVAGTRISGASWSFVAHVANVETGEEWIEVVGGRKGDRAVRSFRPDQLYAVSARPGRDPSLAQAPGLPLG